jgi:hypothetical protein
MQATKDTFFAVLRDGLAEIDGAATAVVGGAVRPAVMVSENERPETAGATGVFCLTWGAPVAVESSRRRALHSMPVSIEYAEDGSEEMSGRDRGRRLDAMDAKLRKALSAGSAEKQDYTQSPVAALGTRLLWGAPEFEAAEQNGAWLTRVAKMTVYFYPEVSE